MTLNGLAAGAYEFRVRTVDLNGFAQPEPRPYPKSGRNEIQYRPIMVIGVTAPHSVGNSDTAGALTLPAAHLRARPVKKDERRCIGHTDVLGVLPIHFRMEVQPHQSTRSP